MSGSVTPGRPCPHGDQETSWQPLLDSTETGDHPEAQRDQGERSLHSHPAPLGMPQS